MLPNLTEFQTLFGQVLDAPLDFDSGTATVQKKNYSTDITNGALNRHIKSGPDAMATYNEQYWYRMFKIMQSSFPLVNNLIGPWELNQVVQQFLRAHPSKNPLLNHLGEGFDAYLLAGPWTTGLKFVERAYDEHRRVLAQAAELDLIFNRLLYCADTDMRYSGKEVIRLKPGFALFHESWNLLETRNLMDTYNGGCDGLKPACSHYGIYNSGGRVRCHHLSSAQYRLLLLIQSEGGLDQGLEKAERVFRGSEKAALDSKAEEWFHDWGRRQWFFLSNQ